MAGYGLVQVRSGDTLYDFGTVTAITDTLNKGIASIPIVSLSTDSTFALETNTSNRFHIQFSRKNPVHDDGTGTMITYETDADYFNKSWKWTNSLWVTAITSLLNRWQVRSDGYTLFINVANADRVAGEAVYKEISTLYPSYQGINVYMASLEISLTEGQTEYLTGSAEFVVGGRLTEKLSVAKEDLVKFTLYTQDEFDTEFQEYVAAKSTPTDSVKYIPLNTVNSEKSPYNSHNEYNEGITASKASVFITAIDLRDGVVSTEENLPLMLGREYDLNNSELKDWEFDYYNDLDLITSYTLTGGVENPFEQLRIKISKRAFVRTYPDIAMDLTTGSETNEETGIRARIIPGISRIHLCAVGRGDFVVTECALSGNEYTLVAYSIAETIKGQYFSNTVQIWKSPLTAITDILSNTVWGVKESYAPWQIFSNAKDIDWVDIVRPILKGYDSDDLENYSSPAKAKEALDTNQDDMASRRSVDATVSHLIGQGTGDTFAISVKEGTSIWNVLQACAYILCSKIFFANNRAYIIDYTTLDKATDENILPNLAADPTQANTFSNRLIVRAGLDRAMFPLAWWGITHTVGDQEVYLTEDGSIDGTPLSWDAIRNLPDSEMITTAINNADSLELHSDNSYDRLCGRIYGEVSQDQQGLTTVYNTAAVKYNVFVKYPVTNDDGSVRIATRSAVRTIWYGQIKREDGQTEVAEWISDLDNDKVYIRTNNNDSEYSDVKEIARRSILVAGEHRYELDLTPYFTYLPEYFARRALYTILKYRAEPQETVKFTANERCTGAIKESQSGGWGESYWSALFPNVCAAKQITDIEQEMKVSGIGYYNNSKYYPQKLALSKYSRDYPSGRTTYWFGVTNSLDLASSTSAIETALGK